MAQNRNIFRLADLAARVETLAPSRLAEPWDNVGLQVGDPARAVRRVMTCLEVTAPTLAEARRGRADAIVAHHPLIFHPLKTVLESNPAERLVAELIRSRIGLIVAHTNLDAASWGTNHVLAEACGLRVIGPLEARAPDPTYKFVIFAPEGHEGKIIEAVAKGGGGEIGAYTHCTFRSPGTGTFLGGAGANPFIGQAGRLEEAGELRIEALVPAARRDSVLKEVLAVHPYEEPAYEFYVLAPSASAYGLGCVAEPPAPILAREFAGAVKRKLKLRRVRLSGPDGKKIRRVAICTGSGGSFLARAASQGADALLTGEANYHHGIEAHQRGIAMIEIGHYESERIIAVPLARQLAKDERVGAARVTIFAAENDLQPFEYL